MLPLLLGSLAYLIARIRGAGGTSKTHALSLLPFSLLISPYGWTYDHMLLLATGLGIVASGSARGFAIVIAANVVLLMPLGDASLDQLVWFPAFYCIAVLLAKPIETRSNLGRDLLA